MFAGNGAVCIRTWSCEVQRMKRVLFVDDEPRVLEHLQQILEPQKGQWEMAFAPEGEAALMLLDATPFDVVVSDIAMPGMDGAALMKTICERYPAIVRIVLAAPPEMDEALRAVPMAHQFLLKPCDPNMLRVAVERATRLSNILSNKLLANLVGSVKDLPVLPRTYQALRQKLAEPEACIRDVVHIVEQDVAISAKILQLVNSAFFGLPREVSSVRSAVGFLGIEMVQNLVLSAGVFTVFDKLVQLPGFSCEELQAHSQLTAKIAGQIPASAHVRGVAVVAGVLHDVGKLVPATRAPADFKRALEGAEAEKLPLYVVETELIGVSHAEVGAYLLGIWGLPSPVVEAVAHHHHPARVPQDSLDAVGIVYISNILAHQVADAAPTPKSAAQAAIDPEYLERLGVIEQFPGWQEMAKASAGGLHAER
jgi:HD-like signal output (HDOD) protein